MQGDIESLLKAPCRVCGYNGKGYYQAGTHSKDCFFYTIGGLDERIIFILDEWPHKAKTVEEYYEA